MGAYAPHGGKQTPSSLADFKALGEKHLKERYQTVIDLRQLQEQAAENQIAALPTLVKKLPFPIRNSGGDFSSKELVLIGLELIPQPARKMDAK